MKSALQASYQRPDISVPKPKGAGNTVPARAAANGAGIYFVNSRFLARAKYDLQTQQRHTTEQTCLEKSSVTGGRDPTNFGRLAEASAVVHQPPCTGVGIYAPGRLITSQHRAAGSTPVSSTNRIGLSVSLWTARHSGPVVAMNGANFTANAILGAPGAGCSWFKSNLGHHCSGPSAVVPDLNPGRAANRSHFPLAQGVARCWPAVPRQDGPGRGNLGSLNAGVLKREVSPLKAAERLRGFLAVPSANPQPEPGCRQHSGNLSARAAVSPGFLCLPAGQSVWPVLGKPPRPGLNLLTP